MVYWNSVLLTRPGAKLVDRPLWHNLAHAFAAASISCNLRSHMRNIGPNKRTTTLLREWFNRLRGWFERKILHEEDWAFDLPNGTEAAFEYLKKNTDSRQGRYLFRRDPQSKAKIRLQFSGDRFFLTRKYKTEDYLFLLVFFYVLSGSYLFDGKFIKHKGRKILQGKYRLLRPFYFFLYSMIILGISCFIFAFFFNFFEAFNFTNQENAVQSAVLGIAFMLLWALSFLLFFGFYSFFPWMLMKFEEGHRTDIYRLLCVPGVLHPRQ